MGFVWVFVFVNLLFFQSSPFKGFAYILYFLFFIFGFEGFDLGDSRSFSDQRRRMSDEIGFRRAFPLSYFDKAGV